MLRNNLAPALRALGFKGSGQIYTLPDEDCWALVGIQRSQFSDRYDLRFTYQRDRRRQGNVVWRARSGRA